MCIFYQNVRGLKSKKNSLDNMLEEQKPTIIALVETHLHPEEDMNLEGYTIIRNDRSEKGGGILIAYKENIKNIVTELEMSIEHYEGTWIEINNGVGKIRIGLVYFPQENESKARITKAYTALSEHISQNKERCDEILVIGDFNAKIGRGDQHENQSRSGKIMQDFIKSNELVIVNHLEVTEGRWTRNESGVKSEIDYILSSEKAADVVTEVHIDEEKLYSLYHHKPEGNERRCIYPDHNPMLVQINWTLVRRKQQKSYFVMTENGYSKFESIMAKEKYHEDIIMQNDIEEEYDKFVSRVQETLEKCKTKVKPKNALKVCRQLIKQIKLLKRQIRTNKMSHEERCICLKRVELLKEHCEDQITVKNQKSVKSVIEKIKKTGRSDLRAFWQYNKSNQKVNLHKSAIVDENGTRWEDEEQIKKVFMEYYMKLLKTPLATCAEEKQAEDIVKTGMNGLESIWSSQLSSGKKYEDGEEYDEARESVKKACKNLKSRKSKDQMGWKNEYIKFGGDSMVSGITKLYLMMKQQQKTPTVWQYTKIKSIAKDNTKRINRRRGLFITNIVSKVIERTIKIANERNMKEESPFQFGGIKGRSTVDNLFMLLSIIQRNQYLKMPTYCVFIDLEKCFDHLWLEDSVLELWKSGMALEDLKIILEMNRHSKIVIDTPVGVTEEIMIDNSVKQGTIYGPIMCGKTTSQINNTGENCSYHYGPRIEIKSPVYVDDMMNAGERQAAETFVKKCAVFEKRKKATVNIDKSGCVVVNATGELKELEAEVKNGKIACKPEMKYVGTWIGQKGTYEINIEKGKGLIENLIMKVKNMTAENKVGCLSTILKLELNEIVICPALHHNIQVWHSITKTELEKLESRQGQILKRLLNLPRTTPYYGILYETGIWTVEAKIIYKKLMLLHNFTHSDDKRLAKKIIIEQETHHMKGCWMDSIRKEAAEYGIQTNTQVISVISKRKYKKEIKESIEKKLVNDILRARTTKMRSIIENPFGRKNYLEGSFTSKQITEIIRIKLHMTELKDNYGSSVKCEFCQQEKESTEHILFQCRNLSDLRENTMPISVSSCNREDICKMVGMMNRVLLLKNGSHVHSEIYTL